VAVAEVSAAKATRTSSDSVVRTARRFMMMSALLESRFTCEEERQRFYKKRV